MSQTLPELKESASQTAGPYVHIGCTPNFVGLTGVFPSDLGTSMVGDGAQGERITITGIIYDGTGTPARDAMTEIWQADAAGIYASGDPRGVGDPNFSGWGRCPSDLTSGEFRFETIKPGQVPMKDGTLQAPHISVWIVARGINVGLNTRLYFPDEAAANASDPILNRLEHQNRVPTLIAEKTGEGAYRFDIHLQGDKETVFFDV